MLSRRLSIIAGLLIPFASHAQPVDKYFGYFGGDYESPQAADPANSGFPEFKDHVNLYSILVWTADVSDAGKAGSEAYVLGELAKARAAHVHAIVPAFPFVFRTTFNADRHQNGCWTIEPNAAQAWSSLAQKMVAQGYLVPGDPAHSTVVATYIVDEPNSSGNCLSDVNGQANPAWVNAVNAIRQGPGTATLPIASIMTDNFQNNMRQGIQLIDWVGFDHYGYSDSEWQGAMNALKAIAPTKKYIVVPGARQGCDNVVVEGTARYFNAIENDPSVTWLVPFAWFSGAGSCKGVRDIPSLRATYRDEGLKIRNQQCDVSAGEKWFCGKAGDLSAAINYLLDEN